MPSILSLPPLTQKKKGYVFVNVLFVLENTQEHLCDKVARTTVCCNILIIIVRAPHGAGDSQTSLLHKIVHKDNVYRMRKAAVLSCQHARIDKYFRCCFGAV